MFFTYYDAYVTIGFGKNKRRNFTKEGEAYLCWNGYLSAARICYSSVFRCWVRCSIPRLWSGGYDAVVLDFSYSEMVPVWSLAAQFGVGFGEVLGFSEEDCNAVSLGCAERISVLWSSQL